MVARRAGVPGSPSKQGPPFGGLRLQLYVLKSDGYGMER